MAAASESASVPSNVAKTVVAQLEQHGKVSRGWLGVQIQK
jgi:serine protease Do